MSSERTIKTTKVGFKWLAHYADSASTIGIGPTEVAAINDLQNRWSDGEREDEHRHEWQIGPGWKRCPLCGEVVDLPTAALHPGDGEKG